MDIWSQYCHNNFLNDHLPPQYNKSLCKHVTNIKMSKRKSKGANNIWLNIGNYHYQYINY
ncbi:hypothetical protein HanPSC8_Chr03g0133631 [Helianthus annuus]|nr:hypothetical protein HanPSC8_Chr03g0133631 [Helianthus annuus]